MESHSLTDFHVPSVVAMMGIPRHVVRTPELAAGSLILVPTQGVAHAVIVKLNMAPEEWYA